MGLFGSLFEKKSCDICGKELGLLGKRKLEDGYLCKDCAGELSPFFSEHRSSTVQDIREQLAYREENKARVSAFTPTRTLGLRTRVLIDDDARAFAITSGGPSWREANPDIIDFHQVTGCIVDVRETRTEIERELEDGTTVSYDPPRYDIDYDVFTIIQVNSPNFDEISVKTNASRIETQGSPDYREAVHLAEEIRDALVGARDAIRDEAIAASAPKAARTCPFCGATTFPDANGRCEYCGGAMGSAQ